MIWVVILFDDVLPAVLDINAFGKLAVVGGMFDDAAAEIIGAGGGCVCRLLRGCGADASRGVALGNQGKLSDDAVAPFRCCGVEGDGVDGFFGDFKLKGLLCQIAEAVGG